MQDYISVIFGAVCIGQQCRDKILDGRRDTLAAVFFGGRGREQIAPISPRPPGIDACAQVKNHWGHIFCSHQSRDNYVRHYLDWRLWLGRFCLGVRL